MSSRLRAQNDIPAFPPNTGAWSSRPRRTRRCFHPDSIIFHKKYGAAMADPYFVFALFRVRWCRGSGNERFACFHLFLDLFSNLLHGFWVLLEIRLRVLTSEPKLFLAERIGITALSDHAGRYAHIEEVAGNGDTLVVHDVELAGAKWRRNLVLYDLHLRAVANDLFGLFDLRASTDLDAYRGIELQRVAASGGFRIPEHHANLHANLIDENDRAMRLVDDGRELAERLRHEPRLQAHMRIAHVALDFRLRGECGNRVDDDHVHRVRSHKRLDDFKRLFPVVRLRNEELVDVHADLLRIFRIERVLGVDVRGQASRLLNLRHDVLRERRLSGRLRTVHLDDAPARNAHHAECKIKRETTRRDRVDLHGLCLAKTHD